MVAHGTIVSKVSEQLADATAATCATTIAGDFLLPTRRTPVQWPLGYCRHDMFTRKHDHLSFLCCLWRHRSFAIDSRRGFRSSLYCKNNVSVEGGPTAPTLKNTTSGIMGLVTRIMFREAVLIIAEGPN